jgi:hypothetical protein
MTIKVPRMTQAEAEDRAATLNREHPDRGIYRWIARAESDAWQVVRISIPGGVRLHPLHGAIETRPEPQPAEDPRPAHFKNTGGPWVGGV